MRTIFAALTAPVLALGMFAAGGAAAATLCDAKVGFSADRTLVVEGRTYTGRMVAMPGKERHEQNLNGIPAIFILGADTPIGSAVLPQLHTVVQFAIPPELRLLGASKLAKHASGHETVNGIPTTIYKVDETIPEGHADGTLWLSKDGLPMKLVGTFTNKKGETGSLRWELSNVKIGPQPAASFEAPGNFNKLPAEAVAPLLGLRLRTAQH